MSTTVDENAESPSRSVLSLWPYAIVLAVGILVLLPKLGDFGFWDPWEPKYAESVREMVERDSYVVPYYRQSVRLTKPILVYWGILAGAAVFGLNEFGARIGGVCLALLTMAGVYYAVSRLRGRQAGLLSALVLGTVPQFYFIARQAMPDVYLLTSMGLFLVFFCLGLFGPDERRNVHFGVSYACVALAVLAKGPVIIGTVCSVALAIYAVIQIDPREFWHRGRRLATVLFTGTTIPATAILGGLAFTSYLFGTSPAWWGFSGRSREDMAFVRGRIEDSFSRAHLAEIILLLVILGAVEGLILLIKRGRRRGRPPLVTAAFPLLVALAAAGSFFAGGSSKILAASLLGALACACVIVVSTWQFLHQEWLWPIAQPYVKRIGRQLLLFSVVFLVIAGPWHVAVFVEEGHGYVTDFIIKHNVHRAGEIVNRSGESDFYLRVLIFGLFPWSCFLPVAVASLANWPGRNSLKRYGVEIFLLITTLVTFVVFSGAATKFAHYLSPIVVPVCVLIGLAIDRTFREPHSPASRLAWIVAAALFLPPTLDVLNENGIRLLVASFTMKSAVPSWLVPGWYLQVLLVIAGVCLFASIVVRSRLLLTGLVAAAALLANYNATIFIPALSTNKTMKNLCESWKAQAPDGDPPICFFGDMKHGIFYYTEYRIEMLDTREEFHEFMDPDAPAFCIVEQNAVSTLEQSHRARYPGAKLPIVDDSHFAYKLIRNFD